MPVSLLFKHIWVMWSRYSTTFDAVNVISCFEWQQIQQTQIQGVAVLFTRCRHNRVTSGAPRILASREADSGRKSCSPCPNPRLLSSTDGQNSRLSSLPSSRPMSCWPVDSSHKFLSRISTSIGLLTRDIDIAILSICPSVRPFVWHYLNGLTYHLTFIHSFIHSFIKTVKKQLTKRNWGKYKCIAYISLLLLSTSYTKYKISINTKEKQKEKQKNRKAKKTWQLQRHSTHKCSMAAQTSSLLILLCQ